MAFKTPDRFAGPREEEELRFDDRTADGDPSVEGAIRRIANVLRYYVNGAVTQIARWKNPPSGFDDVDLNGIVDGEGLVYNATTNQIEPIRLEGLLCRLIITTSGQVIYESNGEIILKETP